MSVFSAQDLRDQFLKYFESKDHKIIASASLIPDNDPTVLFTTAGMHPLVPYLMGEKHPQGTRLASVQKCIRTGDIDEVGDTTHHTFFEMLGNWSLGDYDKIKAIDFAWEFLTKTLAINPALLAVSVFQGDENVAEDKVAFEYWLTLGLANAKIAKLGVKDNWWGPAGTTGPCGPDTEIFYWTGDQNKTPDNFDPEDKNWVEIWNNVFMEYNKTADNKFTALQQKNIDTGMGLERTLAVLNGVDDNYKTELFWPIIQELEKLSGKKYEEDKRSFRIVADHIRSAVFILGDNNGVAPSNKDQGYVLRRLIRRAIRFAKIIGIANNFTKILTTLIIKQYGPDYPELIKNQDFVNKEIEQEENKFVSTLEKGLREFAKQKTIDGKTAFVLFSTYGFPLEMTEELARENNIEINNQEFEAEFKKHQDLSRTASAGMFKGGLADDKQNTKRHHTAAHLMLQALRMVLGEHVEQRGSNINEDRMRFDFTHPEKMTPEQIQKVEDIVNEQINKKMPVSYQEMSVAEAKEYGAIGIFEHKYGDKVKVYTMGDFSKEICGGPHVDNTAELGSFKIIKEESSSAGVRRIKAQVK
ncbi:MAG: alanyl-tRNA synthetase [Patescibacteria group bacterium]|nr:alanyl-tRNA synthetase [Patescibacteria group bacterium]